jgi:ATP diphosphatase
MKPSRDISRLIEIMAGLRTPGTGCPWDLEQDFQTIAPYTIEEAYEVADAIERSDREDLRDELGDLLLQVVYHARMAEERGWFDFGAVVEAICAKMIRRHPHVFGDADHTAAEFSAAGLARGTWERIKREERSEETKRRAELGLPERGASLLDGIPAALPALSQAVKLQQKAGTVGFDWNDPRAVLAKLREEIAETEGELDGDRARLKDEIGDMLFAVANLARHLEIDPEAALRGANAKFRQRFGHIERNIEARSGKPLGQASFDEMEALWQEAKRSGQ